MIDIKNRIIFRKSRQILCTRLDYSWSWLERDIMKLESPLEYLEH